MVLAQALGQLAMAAAFQGDTDAARAAADEAETISRQNGYAWQLALVLGSRGITLLNGGGDPVEARAVNEQNVRLARGIGNPWVSAMALFGLSMVAERSGDIDEARVRLAECAAMYRRLRDRHFVNVTQSELGHIERRLGNYAEAVKLYHETIAGWLELGNRAALAHELESLAIIAAAQRRPRRAARLFGAAEALRETIGSSMTPLERTEYAEAISNTHAQIDESEWSTAWAEGRALPLDQAVAFALEE